VLNGHANGKLNGHGGKAKTPVKTSAAARDRERRASLS